MEKKRRKKNKPHGVQRLLETKSWSTIKKNALKRKYGGGSKNN